MAAPFSIRNFVKKQMMKTNDEGIMVMPSDMKLDFGEAVLTKQLMDAGISPDMIKNEKQLISLLDSIDKMMQKAAAPIDKGIASSKSAKIFNLQGEKLDLNQPIIGGTQQGKKINREFFERDAEAKELQKRIESGVASTVEKMLRMEPIDAMKEANRVIKREGPYKNLTQRDAKNILDSTEDHIFERNIKPKETDMDFDEGVTDEVTKAYNDAVKKGKFKGTEEDFRNKIDNMMDEDFAIGGRVGLKSGMTRRKFLEIMGGVGAAGAAAKTGILKLMGKEKAAPVVEKAAEVLGGGTPPPYFFNLVKKIKNLGEDITEKAATTERQKVTKYKDYELTEDLTTGEKTIQKKSIEGDFDTSVPTSEEVYMNYKPGKGQADEATGKVADEYVEDTSYVGTSRGDKGEIVNTVDGVPDEVIQEGTVFEDNITDFATKETTRTKKAEGGRIPFVFGGGILKTIIKNLAKERGVSPSDYLKIANYKALPDSAKRIISKDEFLKLKEEMTPGRIEMVENIRDMIISRQGFEKSKADLAASMNKAAPGYGDEAVKMMFPEGSFKSPVPTGTTKDDVMMMEQLIKNLKTKDREVNASGGLAGMLGE